MPAMGVKTKICGISTPEAVTAALDGGAGWLGFMFFARSPRNVAPDLAARLVQPVRGQARIVAVMVDPDDAEVDRVAQVLKPDLVQLHGAETPALIRSAQAATIPNSRRRSASAVKTWSHRAKYSSCSRPAN